MIVDAWILDAQESRAVRHSSAWSLREALVGCGAYPVLGKGDSLELLVEDSLSNEVRSLPSDKRQLRGVS